LQEGDGSLSKEKVVELLISWICSAEFYQNHSFVCLRLVGLIHGFIRYLLVILVLRLKKTLFYSSFLQSSEIYPSFAIGNLAGNLS
jgi:hypothetical protein